MQPCEITFQKCITYIVLYVDKCVHLYTHHYQDKSIFSLAQKVPVGSLQPITHLDPQLTLGNHCSALTKLCLEFHINEIMQYVLSSFSHQIFLNLNPSCFRSVVCSFLLQSHIVHCMDTPYLFIYPLNRHSCYFLFETTGNKTAQNIH